MEFPSVRYGTASALTNPHGLIPGVLEAFYERQFRQAEEAAARYRAAQLLEKSNAQSRQNALCTPFREEASPSPDQGVEAGFEPFSADFCGTKEKAG